LNTKAPGSEGEQPEGENLGGETSVAELAIVSAISLFALLF